MTRLDDIAVNERAEWAKIHAAAQDAFDRGEVYAYHDGRTTHRCEDMHAFARVTRSERKRLGVRWAEDR